MKRASTRTPISPPLRCCGATVRSPRTLRARNSHYFLDTFVATV